MGPKPRNEQSKFLSCFDVGLITLSEGMFGLGVPSKTYNLLAMGKPIFYIGDSDSEVDLLIRDHSIGWTNNWGNREGIKEALKSLNYANEYGQYAKNIADSSYTSSIILQKFSSILND